jgi:hypothetical protein
MTCYERMLIQLRSTGLYQLKEGSFVAAEMRAYASALDLLFQELNNILIDCFLDEVDSPKGEYFEMLFGFPPTKFPLTDETRAEREEKIRLMKQRLAVKNCDFNKEAILKQIETGGFNVSLTEDFANKKITVNVLEDKQYCEMDEEKTAFIQHILPCHSTAEINLLQIS